MTPKTLWHYTDSAGAYGILTSNTLWATSMGHLNDTGELGYGLTLALEEVNTCHEAADTQLAKDFYQFLHDEVEQAKGSDRFYVACASTEDDDLSQWRAYGRDGGYALGLALSDNASQWVPYMPEPHEVAVTMKVLIERLGLDQWRPATDQPGEPHPVAYKLGYWCPVEYKEDSQRTMLRDIIAHSDDHVASGIAALRGNQQLDDNDSATKHLASMLSNQVVLQALFFKQAAFSGEHEYRIVVADPDVDNIIQFRSGPFGITPYLRITPGSEPRRTTAQQAEPIPLNTVTVGPSAHAVSAQRGMERLLRNQHLSKVKVKPSGATYRET